MTVDGSGQMSMNERVIEDTDLSDLLEKRLRLHDDAAETRKAFQKVDEDVQAAIAKFELDEGQALRVGRFRIEKRHIDSKSVEYDTKDTSRISIKLFA